jgi:hypothetical protein
MFKAIPVVLLVLLAGCVSPGQRTDLTPAQQQALQANINLTVACDSLTTIVSSLQIQKRAGQISIAHDRKILMVLDATDPVCKPGSIRPQDLSTVLHMVRLHLADLRRLERENAK